MRVVVAGYGAVGQKLAARLVVNGDNVLALRRSACDAAPGIETRSVDLTALQPGEWRDIAADAVVCLTSPDRRDEAGYRAAFLAAPLALQAAMPTLQRWIVVTSTAVLGGEAGCWVDEDSSAAPDSWNGRLLLQIEAELRRHLAGLIIARPSGLYGPGRNRTLQRALSGDRGERRWSNRIHIEDAAAALQHLLQLSDPAPSYCLSDENPVLEAELLAELRRMAGLPPLHGVTESEPVSGRRISSRRLRASGFVFRHPDFRSGYAQMLQNHAAHRV